MSGLADRFQRIGSTSNTHIGNDFEEVVQRFFASRGLVLERPFAVAIGHERKKLHKFDLGRANPPVLVECKSCTWTSGGNIPSAKIRSFNEAMLHFAVAPPRSRKILALLQHMRRAESLATYYIRTQGHLIPPEVEVWEIDPDTKNGQCLFPSS